MKSLSVLFSAESGSKQNRYLLVETVLVPTQVWRVRIKKGLVLPKNTWLCPLCTPRSQELCVNRWNWQQFRTTAWFLGCKGGKSVYGVLIPLQCSALNSGKFNAWLVIHFLFCSCKSNQFHWAGSVTGRDFPPHPSVILEFTEDFVLALSRNVTISSSVFTRRWPAHYSATVRATKHRRTFLANFIFVKHFHTEKISGKTTLYVCEVKLYTEHKWKKKSNWGIFSCRTSNIDLSLFFSTLRTHKIKN